MVTLTLVSMDSFTQNISAWQAVGQLVEYLSKGCEFDIVFTDRRVRLANSSGTVLTIEGDPEEMFRIVNISQKYMKSGWDAIHKAYSALDPASRDNGSNILNYALIALIMGMGVADPAEIAELLHEFKQEELVRVAQVAVATKRTFAELVIQLGHDGITSLIRMTEGDMAFSTFIERCRTGKLAPKTVLKRHDPR